MPSKLKTLQDKNKQREIEECFFYMVDGDVVVHKKDLALLLGVTERRIGDYDKKWLKQHSCSANRFAMYDLYSAIDGYRRHVDTRHRQDEALADEEMPESVEALMEYYQQFEKIPIEYLPPDELDRQEKVTKALVSKGKLKTIDELQATAVDVFTSAVFFLKNVANSIPNEFANTSKEKMTIGVNELFKDAIKNVRKRFEKEVKSDTVEIFNRVMELQEQGRDVLEMLSE